MSACRALIGNVQAIVRNLLRIGEGCLKNTSRVPAGHVHWARTVSKNGDLLGGRKDCADHDTARLHVRAEHAEWIGVVRLGERLER